jgi:hypothetical protein
MKALLFAVMLAMVSCQAKDDALRMRPAPRQCPRKSGTCTKEYRPVVCGPNRCQYDNKCLAKANGFGVKDCVVAKVCPDVDGRCTMEYQPTICGPNKCEYTNTCWAKLNGFNVERDCDVAQIEPPYCPRGDGRCTQEYRPVQCGPNKCVYSNPCWAQLGGFDVAKDCKYVNP